MIIKDAIIVTARSDAPLGHLDLNVGSIGIVDGSIRAVGPYEAVKRSCPDAAEVIECRDADHARHLELGVDDRGLEAVRGVSLRVHEGEIVGIAIKCCRAGANATASITAFAQANRQVRDSAIVRI